MFASNIQQNKCSNSSQNLYPELPLRLNRKAPSPTIQSISPLSEPPSIPKPHSRSSSGPNPSSNANPQSLATSATMSELRFQEKKYRADSGREASSPFYNHDEASALPRLSATPSLSPSRRSPGGSFLFDGDPYSASLSNGPSSPACTEEPSSLHISHPLSSYSPHPQIKREGEYNYLHQHQQEQLEEPVLHHYPYNNDHSFTAIFPLTDYTSLTSSSQDTPPSINHYGSLVQDVCYNPVNDTFTARPSKSALFQSNLALNFAGFPADKDTTLPVMPKMTRIIKMRQKRRLQKPINSAAARETEVERKVEDWQLRNSETGIDTPSSSDWDQDDDSTLVGGANTTNDSDSRIGASQTAESGLGLTGNITSASANVDDSDSDGEEESNRVRDTSELTALPESFNDNDIYDNDNKNGLKSDNDVEEEEFDGMTYAERWEGKDKWADIGDGNAQDDFIWATEKGRTVKKQKAYSALLWICLKSVGRRGFIVSDIYKWFEKRWAYYRNNGKPTAWQTSIRHNLSQNTDTFESTEDLTKDGNKKIGKIYRISKEALVRGEPVATSRNRPKNLKRKGRNSRAVRCLTRDDSVDLDMPVTRSGTAYKTASEGRNTRARRAAAKRARASSLTPSDDEASVSNETSSSEMGTRSPRRKRVRYSSLGLEDYVPVRSKSKAYLESIPESPVISAPIRAGSKSFVSKKTLKLPPRKLPVAPRPSFRASNKRPRVESAVVPNRKRQRTIESHVHFEEANSDHDSSDLSGEETFLPGYSWQTIKVDGLPDVVLQVKDTTDEEEDYDEDYSRDSSRANSILSSIDGQDLASIPEPAQQYFRLANPTPSGMPNIDNDGEYYGIDLEDDMPIDFEQYTQYPSEISDEEFYYRFDEDWQRVNQNGGAVPTPEDAAAKKRAEKRLLNKFLADFESQVQQQRLEYTAAQAQVNAIPLFGGPHFSDEILAENEITPDGEASVEKEPENRTGAIDLEEKFEDLFDNMMREYTNGWNDGEQML